MSHVRGNPAMEVGRNLNRTCDPVRRANPIEVGRKTVGKSDWLIVLGDGKADHREKGPAVLRSLQRKHKSGEKDWNNLGEPHGGE